MYIYIYSILYRNYIIENKIFKYKKKNNNNNKYIYIYIYYIIE